MALQVIGKNKNDNAHWMHLKIIKELIILFKKQTNISYCDWISNN